MRDKRAVFEQDVPLAEGTPLEVRPRRSDAETQTQAEQALKERLRAEGILTPAEAQGNDEDDEFEPVTVTGQPLSEQIIEERR